MKNTEKNWAIKVTKEGDQIGVKFNNDFNGFEMTNLVANVFKSFGNQLIEKGWEEFVYDQSKQLMEAAKEKMEVDEGKPDVTIEVVKFDDPDEALKFLKELVEDEK